MRANSDRELKKGTADLLVLSLLQEKERHGYELAKLIERRSDEVLVFRVASLYTLLHRLEGQGLIRGRWVEKSTQRRRRFYRLTPLGRATLKRGQHGWQRFVNAVQQVIEPDPA